MGIGQISVPWGQIWLWFQGQTLGFFVVVFCFWIFKTVPAVLELALVDQAGLKYTAIRLPLPPECWD